MKTQYNGPEMNGRKLLVLLLTAAVILTLFLLRYRNHRLSDDTASIHEREMVRQYVDISEYDSLIRAHEDSIADWYLLSAIAYVESKFDTTLVSPAGAVGLMQIMPSTYNGILLEMGKDTTLRSSELDVEVAVHYLHKLNDMFDFIDQEERLNYILGSYNCGAGHVFDAMRLARRDGICRYNWASLTPVLKSLSEEKVYTDTLCRNGRFDAGETLRYVERVKQKYHEYRFLDLTFQASERISENIKE